MSKNDSLTSDAPASMRQHSYKKLTTWITYGLLLFLCIYFIKFGMTLRFADTHDVSAASFRNGAVVLLATVATVIIIYRHRLFRWSVEQSRSLRKFRERDSHGHRRAYKAMTGHSHVASRRDIASLWLRYGLINAIGFGLAAWCFGMALAGGNESLAALLASSGLVCLMYAAREWFRLRREQRIAASPYGSMP